MKRSFFLALCLMTPMAWAQLPNLNAPPIPSSGEIEVYAQQQTFDSESKTFVFDGAVEVHYGKDFTLTAERVVYYQESGWIEADGSVELRSGQDVLSADEVSYNFKTGRAKMKHVSAVFHPSLIVEAELLEKLSPHKKTGLERYWVQKARFTSCNRPGTGWNIQVRSGLIHKDRSLQLWGAKFQIRGLPLLYLPYYFQSLRSERASGFLPPRFGVDTIYGLYVENEYFWAIRDWLDASFLLRPFLGERIDLGAEVRFKLTPRDPINRIQLLFEKVFERGSRTAQNIVSLSALLNHALGPNLKVISNISLRNQSDLENFNSPLDASQWYSKAELSLNQTWGNHNLRLLASTRETVVGRKSIFQRLPSLIYTNGLPWKLLGNLLQLKLETFSLEQLHRVEKLTAPTAFEVQRWMFRAHIIPTLQATIVLPGVSIEPTFSLVETYWSSRRLIDPNMPTTFATLPTEPQILDAEAGAFIGHAGSGLFRHLYRVGAQVKGPSFYHIYETKDGGKIKHLIQPTFSYQFAPFLDETEVVDTGEPNVDRLGTTAHRISYGISNILLSKKKGQQAPQEIFRFDLRQNYRFLRQQERLLAPNAEALGDLNAAFVATPGKSWSAQAELDLHAQDFHLRQISGSLGLEQPLWGLRLDYLRQAEPSRENWTTLRHSLLLGGHMRLDQHWSLSGEGNYNFVNSILAHGAIRVGYQAQCWGASVGGGLNQRKLGIADNAPTESHWNFELSVNFLNLGSLGGNSRLR